MKIRYLELDSCLRDPRRWVASRLNSTGPIPRPGYDYCLREGIFHFHRNNDPLRAREYILQSVTRRGLQNGIRIEGITDRFDAYIGWFEAAGVTVAAHRFVLSYALADGVFLGGTVSRIDMIPEGYRGILLGPIPREWSKQFHMPLIQRALARQYGRPEQKFWVGCQELDGGNLETVSFSPTELDDAESKAQQLAARVAYEVTKAARAL